MQQRKGRPEHKCDANRQNPARCLSFHGFTAKGFRVPGRACSKVSASAEGKPVFQSRNLFIWFTSTNTLICSYRQAQISPDVGLPGKIAGTGQVGMVPLGVIRILYPGNRRQRGALAAPRSRTARPRASGRLPGAGYLQWMVEAVVPGQHVPAEVAVEVSPDGVAVVVVVLGIVVFDQE